MRCCIPLIGSCFVWCYSPAGFGKDHSTQESSDAIDYAQTAYLLFEEQIGPVTLLMGTSERKNGDTTRGDRAGNHSSVSLEFARPEAFLSPFHYLEVA